MSVDFKTAYFNAVLVAIDAPDGRWLLSIFNDCGEVDYVEVAVAPDGRAGDFDAWWPDGGADASPFEQLDEREFARFERLVFDAQPAGALRCPSCEGPLYLGLDGLDCWGCCREVAVP